MNLRILKKLSKRAAAYLPLLGDRRQQFAAIADENYHGLVIKDRKCWDRSRCHPTYTGWGDEIVYTTRAGHRIVMRNPSHPLPGTIMVGSTEGYYEPEWSEETAWSALQELVCCHFTDWDAVARDDDSKPWSTRRLRTPPDVFAAADEMLREQDADEDCSDLEIAA